MFNIFKKQTAPAAVKATKQYPKEVLEIHHEFETAADKLLEQAKEMIAKASHPMIEKSKRLLSLGFKQAQQAEEGSKILQQAEISKEVSELIKYYQIHYPNNKFITEEQVKAICYKYNLVCGEVGRYKGFVPEEKLRQIEGFRLRAADFGLFTSNGMFLKNGEVRMDGGYYHIYIKKETNSYKYAFQSRDGIEFYASDSSNLFGLAEIGWMSFTIISGLQICAPVKDMDLSGMTITNGYKLQKVHVPDPVVLQPVKGGYLILAAWGDEASDELVVNQNQN